jgi:hypothetical protein
LRRLATGPRVIALVAAAFSVLAAPGAAAQDGPALISVDGACPHEPAIDAAIAGLIPRGVAALPETARVAVVDLGETYRVEVKGDSAARTRLFRDPARDCEQRARFAAVFIVLTLLPPELAAPPQPKPPAAPPPPPPPPAPAPPAAAPPPAPRRWRVEATAILDGAPAVAAGASLLATGGEVRAVRMLGPIALALGVGLEPGASFSIGGLDVRETRVPLDVSLRLQRALGRVELGGELGIAAAPFHAEGLGTAMPASGTRLDLGVRAGATARFGRPSTRLAPFVGLHLVLFPYPYEIAANPAGGLGTTPALWLGARAGLSFAL